MSETRTKRQLCSACGRPCRVCLCSSLPSSPLRLGGLLLVLQHPHEAKRKLATVPVLQKCLGLCAVVRDRRLLPGRYPLVDQLVAAAAAGQLPLFVLYPGAGATAIQQAAAAMGHTPATAGTPSSGPSTSGSAPCCQAPSHAAAVSKPTCALDGKEPLASLAGLQYVLLLIDGTWHQAREMFQVLAPWLLQPSGPGVQVALPTCGLPSMAGGTTGVSPADGLAHGAEHSAGGTSAQVTLMSTEHQQGQAAAAGPELGAVQGAAGLAAAPNSTRHGGPAVQRSRSSHEGHHRPDVSQLEADHSTAPSAALPPSVALPMADEMGKCSIADVTNDPGCRLRTQPADGCMTTMEATARALAALEAAAAGGGDGRLVLEVLLKPLRRMTALQAQWDPAVAARTAQALQQEQELVRPPQRLQSVAS